MARAGVAVIVISDDLDELLQLADRIGVMRAGRIDVHRRCPVVHSSRAASGHHDRKGGTGRMSRIVAVKNYGFAWYPTFGLSEEAAAARMADQGIDWVVIQNLLDPVPGSAVDQAPPPPSYSDRRFRDALRDRGIRYFEASAVFFRPDASAATPR